MDPMVYLSFCILFMSLIVEKPGANGMNISLTVLKKTVGKKTQVVVVQDKTNKAAVNKKNGVRSSRNGDVFYGTTLQWAWFQGSLPSGAVSFWNSYAKRTEYPCIEAGCAAGFYTPSGGPYCFYPYGDRESNTSQFWILANDYNFESLGWKGGSYGSVPSDSINTCPGSLIFVGKNKYGLGKVDAKNNAFFIGIDGKEYWYKSYDVLTVNKDYRAQSIHITKYDTDQGEYNDENLVLVSSKVTNNDCKAAKKNTQLSGTVSNERRWDVNISLSESLGISMTAGIPEFFGISWGISSEKTFQWIQGSTETTSVTHTETVEIEVPPNHVCELTMEGKMMKARIPFTSTVTRTYYNGEKRSATVKGVSQNAVVAQVHTHIKRCQPIPDAPPCDPQTETHE